MLKALQFTTPDLILLTQLSESEWKRLLNFCDAAQLTLLLRDLALDTFPDWVEARTYRNYRDNANRFERLKSMVIEISAALSRRSIDFTMLKGFGHSPAFTPDPLLRAQGDIDLWCLPPGIWNARDVLRELGYVPMARCDGRHLDPMVLPAAWTWRGDFFDPKLPIPVELHYELWDEDMEHLPGLDERGVWDRRSGIALNHVRIPILSPPDALAFAALHVMMHLLHGQLRLQRVWEVAYVLKRRAEDEMFWLTWQSSHPPEARKLQVPAFLLADHWFQSGLPNIIEAEAQSISSDVSLWIERYGLSPVEALFVPNKDELWLNLCLLDSITSKISVFCRRVFPVGGALTHVSPKTNPAAGVQKGLPSRPAFLAKRFWLHTRTLFPTCVEAFKWWWSRQQLGAEFFRFLTVSVLFDFGEFIFFLLYNLYLLDLGHSEKFLGQVSASVTAGTFVAIMPVAAVTRRLGLRKSVFIAILGTATATTLRAILPWPPGLLISAFLNGLFMSFWAVILPPAVAGLTISRNRTLAFSLITSMGIGIGGIAGLVGGRLPALIVQLLPRLSGVQGKQLALLAGSAFAALAIFPAISLGFRQTETETRPRNKIYPRSRFVYSFLLAFFVYSLGTAGFNPFFNAYFSKHIHMSVQAIGSVFSYGQLAQVFVILLAPAVLKKLGDVRGITYLQLATALMLFLLGVIVTPPLAAITYIAYVCFQYMSEPCLLSILMSRVAPAEQSGASAMNFLVAAAAGILAAMAAGAMFSRFGYAATIAGCAITTAFAAVLFYCLFSVRRTNNLQDSCHQTAPHAHP